MSGVAFITATKYINGSEHGCFYIGSVQDDGFIYFNDEIMYRYLESQQYLQHYEHKKFLWCQSFNLTNVNVISFNPGNIIGGGGTVSPNGSVESAVQWAISMEGKASYSQSNRNLKVLNGSSYDCSSFVITAFYAAGIDVNATYTGDMKAGFTALGWTWIPGSYFDSSELIRGDILLNEIHHTQMYIGNNQDVNCSSSKNSVIITVHNPDYWGTGWNGVLRKVA